MLLSKIMVDGLFLNNFGDDVVVDDDGGVVVMMYAAEYVY